jgi:hypothetical protein
MINHRMGLKCSSQRRCGRITCEPCARRYAGRVSRRILGTATGSLYAIEFGIRVSSPADFWAWRVEARNSIDYRRRGDRWWRDISLNVWLCADGYVRGVVALGSLTASEVVATFDARWATTLRPIDPAHLRTEIYAAIRPAVIAAQRPSCGRYQSLKFAVWPQRSLPKKMRLPDPRLPGRYIEPMPILL